MNKGKTNIKKIKINIFILMIPFFLFALLIGRLSYLCLINFSIGSETIGEFIQNRNINSEVLFPNRGSIYDSSGNILAQDVSSYTVIAYLDSNRSENNSEPLHVVDKVNTASILAPLINMTEEDILKLLNKENVYQVELGPGGRNLSQLHMEEIANLKLPGIDFVKSYKRYYPKGDFASYTLGYTVNKNENEENYIVGELGIEGYFNDTLTGKKGYLEYERDRYGYKIPNGREYIEEAVDGSDIYLTIDTNIQLFLEDAVKKATESSNAEWVTITVMNAKTGEILGTSSSPSFDPNIRNMTSYLNPLVSYTYEPGSIMKIWTYMCAIENGRYNGSNTFASGSIDYIDYRDENKTITVRDWNRTGWGTISYDYGFAQSANTGVANMLEEGVITKNELYDCFRKYGFGNKTDFTMGGELKGDISFNYKVEVANAAFGQGITTTPIQHLQALTSLANNGKMLKPYIVKKIVDSKGNIVLENDKEVVGTIANTSTIDKLKELMSSVINNSAEHGTGYMYKVDEYPVIGKTGTAQVYNSSTGKYYDSPNIIYSFSGLFPEDDPELIIFASMKHPKEANATYLSNYVKDVIKNVGNYLNIHDNSEITVNSSYLLGNYMNKKTVDVFNILDKNDIEVIILGDGDKVINQYPASNIKINTSDKVILLTNNYDRKMIDLTNFSYKEVINTLNLMKIGYEIEGNGYVYEQSISEYSIVGLEDKIFIKLKYK